MELRRKNAESDLVIDVFFTNLLRGKDGLTPFIGKNNHWWIGETDSGVVADAKGANTPYIGDNDNWWINGEDTGKSSIAKIPAGIITMWSGSVNNIPDGWVLCAGQGRLSNGAAIPDLRGRFIVGCHPEIEDYKTTGRKGGSEKVILGPNQLPGHSHGYKNSLGCAQDNNGGAYLQNGVKQKILDAPLIGTHSFYRDTTYLFYVEDTTEKEGNSAEIENRPPYYVLAYIIKL